MDASLMDALLMDALLMDASLMDRPGWMTKAVQRWWQSARLRVSDSSLECYAAQLGR